MPRNYFSGGVGDVLAAGEAGAGFVNDWMDRAAKQRAGFRAAPRIAAGDYRGAAQAYGAEGMADEARTLMGDQQTMDRQAMQDQRQLTQDQIAAGDRAMNAMAEVVDGVQARFPEGQRAQAMPAAKKFLAQFGLDLPLESLTEADLSNHGMATWLDKQRKDWELIKGAGGEVGAYRVNGGVPEYKQLQAPTQRAPVGYTYDDGGHLVIDPGYVEGQRRVSDARAAGTAAHRAPPRGRSGGVGAGLPPPPQGWSPVRR